MYITLHKLEGTYYGGTRDSVILSTCTSKLITTKRKISFQRLLMSSRPSFIHKQKLKLPITV